MPLLDSFRVDHTRMHTPAVRVAKTMTTPKGNTITVLNLRFCIPSKEALSEEDVHTPEHLPTGFMRDHLNGNGVEIIDISPVGCRTGFYMNLIGIPDGQRVTDAWLASVQDVANIKGQSRIPELNECRCGAYLVHSLTGAQEITQNVLARKVAVNKNEDSALDDDFLKG